jgi:pilus assembly protein Flp/PilA
MLEIFQSHIRRVLARFRRDETGAAMVEYGLLVGLIALVVAAGATLLGTDISTMFSNIGTYLVGIPTG